MRDINRVWDSLKPGETVMIEHDSLTPPALGLYHAVMWARKKNYRVVIDDILDTLYLYKVQLELAGFDLNPLEEVEVIKEGGILNVGKVVARLQLKQWAIRQAEYKNVFNPLLEEGRVFNIVLGIEKLFLISDIRENMGIINSILSYTGDKRRIALYFINRDLMETSILPLLEELATTVIRVTKEQNHYILSIVKSVNNELDGIEIALSPKQPKINSQ